MTPEISPIVQILLSTYNGDRYLEAFLDSLVAQTFQDWTLIVRDDGSSDKTLEVLQRWSDANLGKVCLIGEGDGGNVGVIRSFSRLLQASTGSYVMFADQDDIWLPEKVSLTYEAMRETEARRGPGSPILVHTDMRVVDDKLAVLHESFWAFQGLAPGRHNRLARLMLENVVWGCTAMLNRPLVSKVGELPEGLIHHDWWIALVAAAFGEVVSLPVTSILWRRHGANESDVSGVGALSRSALSGATADASARLQRVLVDAQERVASVLTRYRSELAPRDRATAEAFLALPSRGYFGRRVDVLRYGFLFGSPVRNAGLLALI